ncbi:cutinase-domain-containing protein [Emericellopsis atlantica]|uniref:Cutinase-domain-containing protein n=1 Tax=Emericellopsis atlantica TaxID=2614577 RepID=A0A9P7ZMI5_9HYPO|nr:cutinase-domain-containing protein [Emericellopsis atlantica]KAG9254859.1 cutinase-domain-containing protein [Emericellopsis atlantica]
MHTTNILKVVLALGQLVSAQDAECPDLPETGIEIGEPVPINPGDIPPGCSDFEVLVARGTSEPNFADGGKFGVIVGDPVVSNLTEILPGSRGYPVQYPASSSIIIGGIRGRRDVVNRIVSQAEACPDQTFALVGYSQGATIMHRAARDIPEALYDRIVALAMFGDPYLRYSFGDDFPAPLREKLLQNCAEGDATCDQGSCVFWHLTYIRPVWIDRTVEFLAAAFQGNPLPPSTTIGLPGAPQATDLS